MKKLALVSIFLLAVIAVNAKNLKALFDYKTFYAPEQGPYIETYLSIIGTSVNYKLAESGKFIASVEVVMTIKDAIGIKFTDKYNLLSPVSTDTLHALNFVDHHRIQLANGSYTIELSLTDKNGGGKPFAVSLPVKVEYFPNLIAVSDIEFVESFNKSNGKESVLAKNDYEVVPLVDNYFPAKSEKLNFYAEVYNTNKVLGNEPLLVHYFIQTYENKKIMESYSVVLRKTSAEVIPVMSEVNISQLPSGNYQVVLNVKNKNNDLLASKDIFFQRTAAFTVGGTLVENSFVGHYVSPSVLAEDIACLQPISNSLESEFINNQLKLADINVMKNFFFDFWQKRDAVNPEAAWSQYKTQVDKVQQSYGTRAVRGYNTDIGRVYLQYGPPSTITKGDNEPTAYPYEMWRYHKIKNYTDKLFVFWNKDLVGKNYALLHSDMPGEVSDNQWNFKLHSRTMRAESYDDEIKKVNLAGDKTQENFNTK